MGSKKERIIRELRNNYPEPLEHNELAFRAGLTTNEVRKLISQISDRIIIHRDDRYVSYVLK